MIKYYLKVVASVTDDNPIKFSDRTEYYGNRETYLSSYCTPSVDTLELYGFGSYKAAENKKNQMEKQFARDFEKFHTFNHTIEIMSEEI